MKDKIQDLSRIVVWSFPTSKILIGVSIIRRQYSTWAIDRANQRIYSNRNTSGAVSAGKSFSVYDLENYYHDDAAIAMRQLGLISRATYDRLRKQSGATVAHKRRYEKVLGFRNAARAMGVALSAQQNAKLVKYMKG